MSVQQEILPQLVDVCLSHHPQCAIVLIGSVVRGAERPESDVDLNILFPGDALPQQWSLYVQEDNRWQLKQIDTVHGVRIDVAWETEHALLKRLQSDEAINCWPFSNGRALHDPDNIAGHSLEIARIWFANHPEVTSRYKAQYAAAKQQQMRDREH